MTSFFSEWTYLPEIMMEFISSPQMMGLLTLGVALGYIIGVVPGLGPTMGMALCLGVIFKMPPSYGLALLVGILVSALSSGGITACLANIPGTAAAAATCLDGYTMTKLGKGREAVGYSYVSSISGTIIGTIFIFLIQPFVTSIALKFGDWEVFLFCIFGILICGSLTGKHPVKGWVSALLGIMIAGAGAESVQSVARYTFGIPELLGGFDTTVALIGLFGLSEVFYTLKDKEAIKIEGEAGWPKINTSVLLKNKFNILRSALAGIWVGFIPGVGESAACWFSYDLAKRSSKQKERFGKGCEEGIIAAEVANNASSLGALIPALALGIPGSGTVALFLAAMFMIGHRPGPTLLITSPGILSQISFLFIVAALVTLVVAYVLSRYVIMFLTIPKTLLMPIIAVFCFVGAYGTTYTLFSVIAVFGFGVLGLFMKIYNYPIAPMVLGILIGNTLDLSFRRAIMQYSNDLMGLFTRPFGLIIMVVLIIVFILELKRSKVTPENAEELMEQ